MEKIRVEARKMRKPIMEKKRRQRINTSLEFLKRVLLQNTVAVPTNAGGRVAKLEKADILEMTVRYIQTLHKQMGLDKAEKVSSTTQENPMEVIKFKNLVNAINKPSQVSRNTNIFSMMDKENVSPPKCASNSNKIEKKEPHWRPW